MPGSGWNIILPISTLMMNATTGNKVLYDHLIRETVKIIQICTTFDSDDALLLAGEYEDFLQRPILRDLPVALMSESKSTAFELFTLSRYSFTLFKRFSFVHLLWKLNHFVVIASSQPLLRLLLQGIKDSTWSNFNGVHVLIDRKTEERGCVNAYRYLRTAWEYDLLSTIFLCIDPVDGLVIYTYNPYSRNAPTVWGDVGNFKGRSGHPWVLLKRKHRDGPRMCNGLWFDKTTDLNGYEVRLNAIEFNPHVCIDPNKRGLDKFTGDNSEIVKIVFRKLNTTVNVDVRHGTPDDLGGIDSDGIMVGMLAEIGSGNVDMGMNVRSLHAMWKIEHTYPHDQDGFCVITQRSGEVSKLMKILSFMSPGVILGNVVVLLIALFVLTKYGGCLPAGLNIIRLVTCVSILRIPQHSPTRIVLSNVFLMVLIINASFQGHWASLLTIPVSRPNIRTVEDLKNSNYTIYGSRFITDYIYDPVLRSRFHEVAYYHECKQQVLATPYTACLDDCLHLYLGSREKTLHRSRRIQQTIQVYATRENWPMFNRVTDVIRTVVEAGLVNMWRKLNLRKVYMAWKRQRLNDKRKFRILRIRHITFSFCILGIGYFFATLVFVTEILIKWYWKSREKWRIVQHDTRLKRS